MLTSKKTTGLPLARPGMEPTPLIATKSESCTATAVCVHASARGVPPRAVWGEAVRRGRRLWSCADEAQIISLHHGIRSGSDRHRRVRLASFAAAAGSKDLSPLHVQRETDLVLLCFEQLPKWTPSCLLAHGLTFAFFAHRTLAEPGERGRVLHMLIPARRGPPSVPSNMSTLHFD